VLFGSHFLIAAVMAENPRKRKRRRNRPLEVDFESADESTVTFEYIEYDTPAGKFTKRIEVPFTDVPPASTANSSQRDTCMSDEFLASFDAEVGEEEEPPAITPMKNRNKVNKSAARTASAQNGG
jgi:hypothetical protein